VREDLLQPSLSSAPTAAPPSTQAMFLTSFFGGPVAAAAILAVGSYRLRRLRGDWPVLLCLLVLPLALLLWFSLAPGAQSWREWGADNIGRSANTLFSRALALACCGIGYLLHRQAHRNAELLGLKPPNGWLVGLACIAVGLGLTALGASVAAIWVSA
jgi:hypothetical protein